jgi:hypothetical protein
MSSKLLVVWLKRYYAYKLATLPTLDYNSIDLWIKHLTSINVRRFDIPPTLRIKAPYPKVGGFINTLNKVASKFTKMVDIPPPMYTDIMWEDWVVDSDNYPVDVHKAMEDLVSALKRIRSEFNSTEDCDFAASVLEQYKELFLTVEVITTVYTQRIVG